MSRSWPSVSCDSVTRIIGREDVSPHAVAAVNTAVEQLGYRRNRVAQALRAWSTGLVGIVAPQVSTRSFAALIEALDRELRDEDLELILADSRLRSRRKRVVSRFLSTTMSTPSSSSDRSSLERPALASPKDRDRSYRSTSKSTESRAITSASTTRRDACDSEPSWRLVHEGDFRVRLDWQPPS